MAIAPTRFLVMWTRKQPLTGEKEYSKVFTDKEETYRFCRELQNDELCLRFSRHYVGKLLGSFERTKQ